MSHAAATLLLGLLGAGALVGVVAGGRIADALVAARLDVIHHALWGRAEAVRTLLRRMVVATSPLLFGVLADILASSRAHSTSQHGFGANAIVQGLYWAFLLLLAMLAVSGLLTLRARRPRDVATAVASEEGTRQAR